jgi:hypothetical protein
MVTTMIMAIMITVTITTTTVTTTTMVSVIINATNIACASVWCKNWFLSAVEIIIAEAFVLVHFSNDH